MLDVHLDICLTTKTRDLPAVARCRAPEDFDRDLVAQRDVLRGVDHANAARSDLASDSILSAQHGAGQLAGRGAQLATQLQTSLQRRDLIALERARRSLLARAIPHES